MNEHEEACKQAALNHPAVVAKRDELSNQVAVLRNALFALWDVQKDVTLRMSCREEWNTAMNLAGKALKETS